MDLRDIICPYLKAKELFGIGIDPLLATGGGLEDTTVPFWWIIYPEGSVDPVYFDEANGSPYKCIPAYTSSELRIMMGEHFDWAMHQLQTRHLSEPEAAHRASALILLLKSGKITAEECVGLLLK
jgi:hypothetical protein